MTGHPAPTRPLTAPRLVRTAPVAAADVAVRRIRLALAGFVVIVLATLGQLVNIQVLRAEEYADRGERQRVRTVDLAASRGRIYDREGDILATSVTAATVYADPRAFRASTTADGLARPAAGDVESTARTLAPLLDRDAASIAAALRRDAHFVYLARQVDHETGERIAALRLPGIGVYDEPQRVYPAGGLAAQVLGFTGVDGEALGGLESHYDAVLRGTPGSLVVERAPGGLVIASAPRDVTPPRAGTDLVLTIDREIQAAAERVAAETIERFSAKGASVIVLEVGTGEVLAMASAPTFDPHRRVDGEQDRWRNRAVTDVFEPGSIQKALTMAAALEQGAVGRAQTFEVADRITIHDKTFTDAEPHPTLMLDPGGILARSSNVGTIRIAQQLGSTALHDGLIGFGYGRPTGIDFPGESSGILAPVDRWWGTSLPTIAIGHGTAVTLLQVANAYATLGNDGVAVQPRLVRGTVGEDGTLTPTSVAASQRVISAESARQVRMMLEGAVTGDGATGALAAVPGYRVGGKTGTALKPDPNGGYADAYVASFVGIAPLDDPRLVVAVMVDEPYPFYGGIVAAPAFSQIMHAALLARRVSPDQGGASLETAFAQARERARAAATTTAPLATTGGASTP